MIPRARLPPNSQPARNEVSDDAKRSEPKERRNFERNAKAALRTAAPRTKSR